MVELEPVTPERTDQLTEMVPRASQMEVDSEGLPYVYTGMRVRIRGRYEYIDSPNFCVGHGGFGDVFKVKYDRL